jgi:DNA adenine methylase
MRSITPNPPFPIGFSVCPDYSSLSQGVSSMNIQPLIKWPGGKTEELSYIRPHIQPSQASSRLIEPFMGGGAVFWNRPEGMGLIAGDISPGIVALHQFVRDENSGFRSILNSLLRLWEASDIRTSLDAAENIMAGSGCWLNSFYITSKTKFESRGVSENRDAHFRKKASYLWARHLLNSGLNDDVLNTGLFWFVRELCYGAMFRTNRRGAMNVPYGGMSYDGKNLRTKFSQAWDEKRIQNLRGADIAIRDFSETMSLTRSEDVVFLDPPYDSPFSSYDGNLFGRTDHERLAQAISDLPPKTKWVMAIARTPMVEELYVKHPRVREIFSFEKIYRTNIKGRYDRSALHYIIAGN